MNEFLYMGGHAAYIWPCYLMAAFLLIAILVNSLLSLKKSRRDLAIMEGLQDNNGAESPNEHLERQAT